MAGEDGTSVFLCLSLLRAHSSSTGTLGRLSQNAPQRRLVQILSELRTQRPRRETHLLKVTQRVARLGPETEASGAEARPLLSADFLKQFSLHDGWAFLQLHQNPRRAKSGHWRRRGEAFGPSHKFPNEIRIQ